MPVTRCRSNSGLNLLSGGITLNTVPIGDSDGKLQNGPMRVVGDVLVSDLPIQAPDLAPTLTTFVNSNQIIIENVIRFFIPNVFLVAENTDILGLPIQVSANGDSEEYLSVGARELDGGGNWKIGAERNAFRGRFSGKYVVFDDSVGHWVIGQLVDHNVGGFAGTDKDALNGTGFIPEPHGVYDIYFDFSQIPVLYLEECEPIVTFDEAGSSIIVSFNGAHKTGLLVI